MRRWFATTVLLLHAGLAAALTDLNAATPDMLEELHGIGPTRAEAIVRYREEHGPFRHLDQLLDVKGIGPKTLERIRSQLIIGSGGMERSARPAKRATYRPLDAQVFPP